MNEITTYRGAPLDASRLTEQQRDSVAYLFYRLKTVDPSEYDRIIPDESTERALKREYAAHIIEFDRAAIDKGIDLWHTCRQKSGREYSEYKFLKIDTVIGLIYEANRTRAERKYFFDSPRLPEPEYQKRKRKEKGRKALSSIKSFLDE